MPDGASASAALLSGKLDIMYAVAANGAARAAVTGYKGWALDQPRGWGVRKTGS